MKKIKLKDLFPNIKIGGTPPRASQENFGGGFPWVSIKDMSQGKVIEDTNETLSEIGIQNSNVKKIQKGSLLFSFKLTVGKVAFAGKELYTNEAIAAFEPGNPDVLLEYLYYCLPIYAKKNGRTNNYGAPLLNKEIIKEIEIPLPTIEEQRIIVQKLNKLSELISLKEEAIKKTEALTKSVFLEMFGDISKNERNYYKKSLGIIASIEAKMVNPLDSEYQDLFCIGGANIVSETGDLIELKTAKQEGSISGKFFVGHEDILYSKIRPVLKKVTFPKFECLCSADIYPLRPHRDYVTHSFLIEYLLSDSFTSRVSEISEKRAQIPKINREELFSFEVPIPPIELQIKYENFVKSQSIIKNNQKQSLQKLQSLYDTTTQEIFG